MSLTAPGCPVAGEMPGQVADTIAKMDDVGLIEVELVWEPPWTKDRMSEDAKMALDIY
jgi:metal-sulfur cluster biosynthetic enzyme